MRPATLQFYKESMLRVVLKIQQELDDDLDLEQLAVVAHLSPFHFHRVFTGMIGETVKSHIRRLRLERAASRLKLTRRPVIQIALEAGYETHEAFSRMFKHHFGVSPSAYRAAKNTCPALLPSSSGLHYHAHKPIVGFRAKPVRGTLMNVHIETVPARKVAFMRHIGPYSTCGKTWDKFLTEMGAQGLIGPQTLFIGLSHDDPEVTEPAKIRYDACVTVGPDFQPAGELGVQIIPGGDYAVLTHLGPYETLGKSYNRLLGQWIPRCGRQLGSSPCFEIYFNSPENTEPQDLVTDIYAPLVQQGSVL